MRCLMFLLCSLNFSRPFLKGLPKLNGNLLQRFRLFATDPEIRNEDFNQMKDLDLILSERAKRFNLGPTAIAKEQCILLTVESRSQNLRSQANVSSENEYFSFEESLNELSELVGTAGLEVKGICVQRLQAPNSNSYINSGKAFDVMALVNSTGVRTIVVDDDLSPKQQNNLENLCVSYGGVDVKVLDRTAIILEIFAQHAQSREGQLQVELAMLEYRRTRGPRARGEGGNSGAGFRGPGETKLETDRRMIQDKILRVKKEIELMGAQRKQHRKTRERLGIPVVALVGYTNAGKSTLMNRLSRAGVLAENMLFATLDPTTRKLNLPRVIRDKSVASLSGHSVSSSTESRSVLVVEEDGSSIYELDDESVINSSTTSNDILSTSTSTSTTETSTALVAPNIASQSAIPPEPIQFETYADCEVSKGQEIFLTDTVGFISKLPTDLIAAFRATLEEVREADVLIHVCDRSSPVWRKQRRTVLKELAAIGCTNIPIVELWNKIDMMPNSVEVMLEASRVPVDVEGVFGTKPISDDTAISTYVTTDSNFDESNNIKSNRIVSDSSTSTNTSPPKHKAPSFSESKRNQAYSGYSKDGKGGSSGRGAKRVPVEDNYFWSGEDDEYITQDAPITYSKSVPTSTSSTMTTTGNDDMESFSNQNQEETMSAISSTDSSGTGPLFTVAASVKSGLGFNNFLLTLEKALTLKQETVVLFVPYDKDDGTVTLVFSQATIESVEYKDTGTYIVCKISDSMLAKVNKFIVNDDIIFM